MWTIGRDPGEVKTLERLLTAKIERSVAASAGGSASPLLLDADAAEELRDTRVEFARLQFCSPMGNYTRWGGWYGVAFTVLSLAALVAGLASSGIAAGWSEADWARWWILGLGLVAAVAAAVNQVWKPGQKSASRTRGGNALRREAWDYLNDLGRYEELKSSPQEAFGLFANQVSAIVRAAEEVDEEAPGSPAPQHTTQ
jgi:hypothetical protein